MQQRASPLHYRFIGHRDHDHVVRIGDMIWNKRELATDPSDSLDRWVKKKISLACFILGSRLWQARMQRERYFVFPFFLLDPALDRFSDLLFIPKQDKKPQREEIKDENSCCSFWFPEPRIDLSYLRTRSRMLRLLLHPSTVTKWREGGGSLHLTSPRHLKPFSSVCFYTKAHTLGF